MIGKWRLTLVGGYDPKVKPSIKYAHCPHCGHSGTTIVAGQIKWRCLLCNIWNTEQV